MKLAAPLKRAVPRLHGTPVYRSGPMSGLAGVRAQMRAGNWEPRFHMHRRATPMGSEDLCELLFPYYQQYGSPGLSSPALDSKPESAEL